MPILLRSLWGCALCVDWGNYIYIFYIHMSSPVTLSGEYTNTMIKTICEDEPVT